jgi:hypothetical protein
MTPVPATASLGDGVPLRFRVLTHVVEILEVVETGHQPITAKNDPSDQESDVHLGSFLSAMLDKSWCKADSPAYIPLTA